MTAIEWTERTWNPIVGCSIVSPGCTHCYAMRMAARLEAMAVANGARILDGETRPEPLSHYLGTTKPSKAGPVWTGKVAMAPDRVLTEPLRRQKPAMWFVNSMGDLFHEDVPDDWIDRVFAVMALCPQHTFQVLTKRSARMRAYVVGPWPQRVASTILHMPRSLVSGEEALRPLGNRMAEHDPEYVRWPLPNVWLGVSAERQAEADARIPDLLATPAAVRFVSCEPLLGPVDLTRARTAAGDQISALRHVHRSVARNVTVTLAGFEQRLGAGHGEVEISRPSLDWVIVGGESGHGARPMHPDWARSIRDQCTAAGVPFFFKQWGAWSPYSLHPVSKQAGTLTRMTCVSSTDRKQVGRESYLAGCGEGKPSIPMRNVGKAGSGRLLDGRTWNEMPAPTNPAQRSPETT